MMKYCACLLALALLHLPASASEAPSASAPCRESCPTWHGDALEWVRLAGHECLTQSFVVRPDQRLVRVEVFVRDGDDPADVGKELKIALGRVQYASIGQRKIVKTITVPAQQIDGPTWVAITPTADRHNRPYWVEVSADDAAYRQRVEIALCPQSTNPVGRAGCAPLGVKLLDAAADFHVRVVVEPIPAPTSFSCLRNGRFSSYVPQTGPELPACWFTTTETGQCTFSLAPQRHYIQNAASVAVVNTDGAGSGYWRQTVAAIPGMYTLTAEVQSSPSGAAYLAAGDNQTEPVTATEWQPVSLAFETQDAVDVRLGFRGEGTGRFRNVSVVPRVLETGKVAFLGGSTLGALVLPPDPSPAEQYAAWELQHYIHEMTDVTPGIQARDRTHEGRRVIIGRAADDDLRERLASLAPDAYLLACDSNSITLTGNSDSGTLYAVYDWLAQQGCFWPLPGTKNTIVPRREGLLLPEPMRIESPDYLSRGFHIGTHEYNVAGALIDLNLEDVMDWCVRNRLNAPLMGEYGMTARLGAHRGHGFQQTDDHSWLKYMLPTRSDWWALVDGRRQRHHPSRRVNQLCLSNESLRDWVSADIIQFFAAFPEMQAYSLSANDHTHWCECRNCRALDPDGGSGPWQRDHVGNMTDRSLNFVNDVAARVAQVFPDKRVLLYSYARTSSPPDRERVHPNVQIKFCWHGFPRNRPIAESAATRQRVEAWQAAGMIGFGLYDYGNFFHRDCPNFWFYHQTDYLKTFHDWGCRHSVGESSNRITGSMMWYQLRLRSYWDTEIDHVREMQDICHRCFGPAHAEMYAYYTFMAQQELDSRLWDQTSGTQSLNPDALARAADFGDNTEIACLFFADFSFAVQQRGLAFLERALTRAQGDEQTERHIQRELLQHHLLTIALARNTRRNLPAETRIFAAASFARARSLARSLDARFLKRHLLDDLQLPPAVPDNPDVIFELPLQWKFRLDPLDKGVAEGWHKAAPTGDEWRDISVTKDWTTQGYAYHGVAWYAVALHWAGDSPLGRNEGNRLGLLFGAVDGTADVYLDGRLIGQQKIKPEVMWNRPFVVALPNGLDWQAEHMLSVRVRKNQHAAGIWKPVSTIRLEAQYQ